MNEDFRRKRQNADALAILRIGGSFDDAMKASGLTFEQVQKLWKDRGEK